MIGCRPLTPDEQARLLKALPTQRDRLLLTLLLFTGFRISEALSLNVVDVAGQDRITVFKRHMKGRTSSRTLLMHPELKMQLEAYLEAEGASGGLPQTETSGAQLTEPPKSHIEAPKTAPLFRTRTGTRLGPQAAWKVLRSAVKRAGLKGRISFHSGRKTFAQAVHTHFKHDLVKTSKALGHKSVLSTAAYLSFQEEELDAAILGMPT